MVLYIVLLTPMYLHSLPSPPLQLLQNVKVWHLHYLFCARFLQPSLQDLQVARRIERGLLRVDFVHRLDASRGRSRFRFGRDGGGSSSSDSEGGGGGDFALST